MIWLATNWKKVLLAALVAGAFATGWWKGGDVVQRKWDADTAREVKEQLIKNQEDAAKLKKLEEAKNENIVEIDRLRANNRALWMRIPKTPCAGNQTGSDTTSGSGELPTEAETAFQRFREGLADEAYRADSIVENCRVLNEWVK